MQHSDGGSWVFAPGQRVQQRRHLLTPGGADGGNLGHLLTRKRGLGNGLVVDSEASDQEGRRPAMQSSMLITRRQQTEAHLAWALRQHGVDIAALGQVFQQITDSAIAYLEAIRSPLRPESAPGRPGRRQRVCRSPARVQ